MTRTLTIILLMLPFVVSAQVRIPKFPIDSATNQIVYRSTIDLPGVKKEKIMELTVKWYSDYVSAKNSANTFTRGDQIEFSGAAGYSINYSRGSENAGSGKFEATYSISYEQYLTATDGKLDITLRNFKFYPFGYGVPLEEFRDRHFPAIPLVYQQYESNISTMYSSALDDINYRAGDFLKDIEKYLKKAKKKGMI